MLNKYENEFNNWIDKEKKAIELINVVGKLWFDRSIELLLFRKPLFDIGSSEVLAHHQYAKDILNKNISIYDSLAIAQAIAKSNLAPSRIDIGRLASEWIDTSGKFTITEDFENKALIINGQVIYMIAAKDPAGADYEAYGINNAIVPVLKIIEDTFGIEKGHIETVHSYTNDHNLLDNYHKKYRRGRLAALNMFITETGAYNAVSKVFPALEGKLTGNAVRVPTPDVSLAILNLTLNSRICKADIEEKLKNASLFGNLVEQIEYSISNELV